MKTKFKVGDIIYCVNPQRLIVSKASVIKIEEDSEGLISLDVKVYELLKETIRLTFSKFPIEKNKLFSFRTQSDALEFVKAQIGL